MKTQDKIIKTLKDFGRLSTARLSAIIGVQFQKGLKLLNEMDKKNEIIKEEETTATYWRLK